MVDRNGALAFGDPAWPSSGEAGHPTSRSLLSLRLGETTKAGLVVRHDIRHIILLSSVLFAIY